MIFNLFPQVVEGVTITRSLILLRTGSWGMKQMKDFRVTTTTQGNYDLFLKWSLFVPLKIVLEIHAFSYKTANKMSLSLQQSV
jgi:hypothetical protein